ncbi:MAG: ABC transporter permease subunit [Desulfurococcaceae archaeon]
MKFQPNAFNALNYVLLLLFLLFFLLVLVSPAAFVKPDGMIRSLLSDEIGYALALSILTATCSTLISVVIGLPAAYVLSRFNFPGKKVVEGFLDVPLSLPPVALGASLLIFFSKNPLGIFINENLVRFVFEVPGIIVAQFVVVSPITMKILKEVFDGIPVRYEWMARVLGYSHVEAFLYVVLPLAKHGVLAATLLSWAKALGEFGATMMLAGATRFKTETLPIALYLKLAEADLEGVAVIIYVLVTTACIVTIAARKFLTKVSMT